MSGLKIYCLGELQGTVEFDENKGMMLFSTSNVKNIVNSIRETHFSSTTPDENIFDELPLILRGQYYCQGDED